MMNLNWILAYLDEEADQQLLEDIFYTYSKQMAEYAGTILQNKDDVEDVVGTVFERIAARTFDVVRSIQNETDLRNYVLKGLRFLGRPFRALPHHKRGAVRRRLYRRGLPQDGVRGSSAGASFIARKVPRRTLLPLRFGRHGRRRGKANVSIGFRNKTTACPWQENAFELAG